MKLNFAYKTLEMVPAGHIRVRLTEDAKGTKKLVRERDTTTIELGAGKPSEMNQRKFILLCRSIVRAALEFNAGSTSSPQGKKIAIQFDRTPELFTNLQHLTPEEVSVIAASAFEMAQYDYTAYKTKPKDGFATIEEIALCGKSSVSIEAAAKRGQLIGQEVNACRELCNTPGGDMTPKILAHAAKKALADTKATTKILSKKEMEKLGMGAVLGMAKGSAEEPQFIVMEYLPLGRQVGEKNRPLVLVGKGVTFDTGGLNLKPGDHMYEMHMDMSGGAAVIHTLALAAKLKLKVNLVGLVPAIENSPASGAVRPGDILKSLSGKMIEVLNTDAEGRVILADAITYAKRYNPAAVVDVATLTGAALVAIGTQASCFMTNEDDKIPMVMELAEKSGDYMWPFPAWEEYEAMTKSTFGDIPNLSTDGSSRDGGVIAGGMFLKEFAKELECLWIHVDMAPRMTARADEFLAKGAAGAPVRFLLALAEHFAK